MFTIPSLLCCAHTENTSSHCIVWGLATKELRTLNTCKAFTAMHRLAYFLGHQQKIQPCSKLCKWKSYVSSHVEVHWWKYYLPLCSKTSLGGFNSYAVKVIYTKEVKKEQHFALHDMKKQLSLFMIALTRSVLAQRAETDVL